MTKNKNDFNEGAKDWRANGRLDAKKVASRAYRNGAQTARTEQVDEQLRKGKR